MIRRFRAWMIDNNEYWNGNSDGYLLSLEGRFLRAVSGDAGEVEAIVESPEHEARFVFEQSTGRTDANGHEIFEGDILRLDTCEGVYAATVAWSRDLARWTAVANRDAGDILGCHGVEIAGNVHRDTVKESKPWKKS